MMCETCHGCKEYCETCEQPGDECTCGETILERYGPMSGPVEHQNYDEPDIITCPECGGTGHIMPLAPAVETTIRSQGQTLRNYIEQLSDRRRAS